MEHMLVDFDTTLFKTYVSGHLSGSVSEVSDSRFQLGLCLTVHEFKPHTGFSAFSMEPPLDSLSSSLCVPPSLALSLLQK